MPLKFKFKSKDEIPAEHLPFYVERDALNARLVEVAINQGVTVAGSKRGLRPSAIPDALARFRVILQTCANIAMPRQYAGVRARRGERWTGLARASARPANEKW